MTREQPAEREQTAAPTDPVGAAPVGGADPDPARVADPVSAVPDPVGEVGQDGDPAVRDAAQGPAAERQGVADVDPPGEETTLVLAAGSGAVSGVPSADPPTAAEGGSRSAGPSFLPVRPRRGAVAIAVLLALLGFSLVVQVRSISTDSSLATTRQEDLVRILSDLEAQEERLRQEIAELEESQRQLMSGAEGRQAALEAATRQADELGILAGTLRASGPGLAIRFAADSKPVRAFAILDAVQELRGAGAEAMQITGGNGVAVRIVASTAFLQADGGLSVGGTWLTGPYTIMVIGDPTTMRTALNIPGGVVASVRGDGGNVTIEEHAVVDVSAVSRPIDLRHARPVS